MVRSEQAASEADRAGDAADAASHTADVVAGGRDHAATRRDVVSEERDRLAARRDRAADEHDPAERRAGRAHDAAAVQVAELRLQAAADRDLAADDRRRATLDRQQAEGDRERAASDRRLAAVERGHAVTDRRHARAELERAHTDELTGAYRRGAGKLALAHELQRARRCGEDLVVAYVDVDGLKATNDQDGHAAGDARLREVVAAMRSRMRSYEPIVRYGGDEFVCAIAGLELAAVRARFDEMAVVLGSRDRPGSMSVGLAAMRADDTLDELVCRADDALTAERAERGSPTR